MTRFQSGSAGEIAFVNGAVKACVAKMVMAAPATQYAPQLID